MTRFLMLISALATLASMSACGEKPQTLGNMKNDVEPFYGAQNNFVAPGWKPGDKASWEQALKVRAQNNQNEYSKTK
ncbi:MAG: hypothetical protein HHJ16_09065 [Polaromonas sp.]|uniref:hypothetical protein n=1 Tax=Polaromonas sp. TaxID=1869339 RepID=UPI0017C776A5|nr:hypothetical protein [Polaromonas sp.]NMM10410.1 hypothetical protein [Polaromonas sp.]